MLGCMLSAFDDPDAEIFTSLYAKGVPVGVGVDLPDA